MGRYRTIGTNLNRDYRNDLNANFEQIERDISAIDNAAIREELMSELQRVEQESKERDYFYAGENIEALLQSVENAKNSANNAAATAETKGNTAKAQGDKAQQQGNAAEEKANLAQTKADYADEKAVEANEAAGVALQEASNLGQLKQDVVSATQAANTAAGNANQKATLANDKATLAQTQADYARRQGDYAKAQADNIDDIVAGTGFIPTAQKGNAGGVAALDADGDVIDADGNKVEGAVKSVNGQTGEITIDVPTKTSQLQNDSGFETTTGTQDKINAHANNADVHVTASEKTQIGKIADLEQEINAHIEDNAVHVTNLEKDVWNSHTEKEASTTQRGHVQLSNDTNSTSETLAPTMKALNEVKSIANDIKTKWASVIGSPLVSSDTQAQLQSKTQTIKNTLATNLINKGQSASGSETLSSLVAKITSISSGKQTFSFDVTNQNYGYSFQYAGSTGITNMPALSVSGIGFKPSLIVAFETSGKNFMLYSEIHDGYYQKTVKTGKYPNGDDGSSTISNLKGDAEQASVRTGSFLLPVAAYRSRWIGIAIE